MAKSGRYRVEERLMLEKGIDFKGLLVKILSDMGSPMPVYMIKSVLKEKYDVDVSKKTIERYLSQLVAIKRVEPRRVGEGKKRQHLLYTAK